MCFASASEASSSARRRTEATSASSRAHCVACACSDSFNFASNAAVSRSKRNWASDRLLSTRSKQRYCERLTQRNMRCDTRRGGAHSASSAPVFEACNLTAQQSFAAPVLQHHAIAFRLRKAARFLLAIKQLHLQMLSTRRNIPVQLLQAQQLGFVHSILVFRLLQRKALLFSSGGCGQACLKP